jgi:hypothetical protein
VVLCHVTAALLSKSSQQFFRVERAFLHWHLTVVCGSRSAVDVRADPAMCLCQVRGPFCSMIILQLLLHSGESSAVDLKRNLAVYVVCGSVLIYVSPHSYTCCPGTAISALVGMVPHDAGFCSSPCAAAVQQWPTGSRARSAIQKAAVLVAWMTVYRFSAR